MIFGIGSDLVDIRRFEKSIFFLDQFQKKHLTSNERLLLAQRQKSKISVASYLAKRFAAKEAVIKALGTGFRNGIYLNQIEILSDQYGKPFVCLNQKAEEYALKHHIFKIHLSISDEYPYALATAIAEVSD